MPAEIFRRDQYKQRREKFQQDKSTDREFELMIIANDSHCHDHQRQDLALRMIRHEARTCTIRECTGLTDDRIRRLYRVYAKQVNEAPLRRRRGKSPRQFMFFVRTARAQFESSLLASAFAVFGLLQPQQGHGSSKNFNVTPGSLEYGQLFCDAYETHQQLLSAATLSFEHAWFLLQLLNRSSDLLAVRCRYCDSHYLRDRFNICRHSCPTCRLKRTRIHCAKPREHLPCSNVSSRGVSSD